MSLRHFFDPKAVSGAPWLTDRIPGVLNPKIDARKWALSHPQNPYSLQNGLDAYKAALEHPAQHDEKIGLALRCLGETMHVLADMTRPAHVRNDAHATGDPLEHGLTGAIVAENADLPVDPRATLTAATPAQLFSDVATWTQTYFYSDGTIADPGVPVLPDNGTQPYPRPTLADVKWQPLAYDSELEAGFSKYLGIPILQRTLTHDLLGNASPTAYNVPNDLAYHEVRALAPVAVAACQKLARLFFPNLSLQMKTELWDPNPAEQGITGELVHDRANDEVWSGRPIEFQGRVRIYRLREGEEADSAMVPYRKVRFEGGLAIPQTLPADGSIYVAMLDAGCRVFWARVATPDPTVEVALGTPVVVPGEPVAVTWTSTNASHVEDSNVGALPDEVEGVAEVAYNTYGYEVTVADELGRTASDWHGPPTGPLRASFLRGTYQQVTGTLTTTLVVTPTTFHWTNSDSASGASDFVSGTTSLPGRLPLGTDPWFAWGGDVTGASANFAGLIGTYVNITYRWSTDYYADHQLWATFHVGGALPKL
jgi:hypothetical protein